jgi:hypothetical protein
MDLLVRGKSPTEISLKMTEIYLKTVISDLSVSLSLVKPDTGIAFTVRIRRFSVAQVKPFFSNLGFKLKSQKQI